MAGKITNFFREYKMFFSIIMLILGLIIFLIGLAGTLIDSLKNIFSFFNSYWDWSIYLLIIGFIFLAAGIWYLYTYLKDRKFIYNELETNKRSEFLKKHNELKSIVKHMPSKYQKMVKNKEKELNIK